MLAILLLLFKSKLCWTLGIIFVSYSAKDRQNTNARSPACCWLLMLLLFVCFLVETGEGGWAASEGARMARRCDGKVGYFSSFYFLPCFFEKANVTSPSRSHKPPFNLTIYLLTMWSASQRLCRNFCKNNNILVAYTLL